MYLDFYNLKIEPFSLSPDPRFLFLAPSHKEAFAHLKYGLIRHKGFVVLLGEVGTGKTTLIYSLLSQIPERIRITYISNPTLNREEFFFLLAKKYNLGAIENKAEFLIKFSNFLEDAFKKREDVVLIIDEAHCLNEEILEEIRLLSNLETPNAKLINIILTGQPEFEDILENPRFRALKQRINLKYTLKPFSLEQTKTYIQIRMAKAGAKDAGIFTDGAMEAVFEYSKGIPRIINLLCDRALLTGFIKESKVIDEAIIHECAAEIEYKKNQNGKEADIDNGKIKKPIELFLIIFGLLGFFITSYWIFHHSKELYYVVKSILHNFEVD